MLRWLGGAGEEATCLSTLRLTRPVAASLAHPGSLCATFYFIMKVSRVAKSFRNLKVLVVVLCKIFPMFVYL